jgi:TPR repeat protein
MKAWTPEQRHIFNEASAKSDAGDLRGALRLYRKLAKTGDATSQHSLAYTLEAECNPPRKREAAIWYKRAVRNGYAFSAWNLALGYAETRQLRWQMHWLKVYARLDREGAPQDMLEWAQTLIARRRPEEARTYLELAAKLGASGAKNELRKLERKLRRG